MAVGVSELAALARVAVLQVSVFPSLLEHRELFLATIGFTFFVIVLIASTTSSSIAVIPTILATFPSGTGVGIRMDIGLAVVGDNGSLIGESLVPLMHLQEHISRRTVLR